MNLWLRVGGGSLAHLDFPPDNRDIVKIAIERAETEVSSDIQVNQPGLKVGANQRCIVSFRARADAPRSIFVGFANAHAPWRNLGLYSQIELTSQWQSFEKTFISTEDDHNARIHFDVGHSDIPIQLSSVSFRNLSEGGSIEFDQAGHSIWDNSMPEGVSDDLQRLGMNRVSPVRKLTEQARQSYKVEFGSLRRVTPISRDWGWDRGLPLDRYYIETFLSGHREDIRGRVLEIGDNTYTRRFGADRVAVSDVLHVEDGNPLATIVADLTQADHIPAEIFDCIVFTQTLNRIYEPRAALRTLYRILKPCGVLLATFPGITRTDLGEPAGAWYWSFTSASARRLFEEVFSPANVFVESYGNVLVATSFLYGLATEELSQKELEHFDPDCEVLITVRAVKTVL
jgi:SAM-dependent methyltransferase